MKSVALKCISSHSCIKCQNFEKALIKYYKSLAKHYKTFTRTSYQIKVNKLSSFDASIFLICISDREIFKVQLINMLSISFIVNNGS